MRLNLQPVYQQFTQIKKLKKKKKKTQTKPLAASPAQSRAVVSVRPSPGQITSIFQSLFSFSPVLSRKLCMTSYTPKRNGLRKHFPNVLQCETKVVAGLVAQKAGIYPEKCT